MTFFIRFVFSSSRRYLVFGIFQVSEHLPSVMTFSIKISHERNFTSRPRQSVWLAIKNYYLGSGLIKVLPGSFSTTAATLFDALTDIEIVKFMISLLIDPNHCYLLDLLTHDSSFH